MKNLIVYNSTFTNPTKSIATPNLIYIRYIKNIKIDNCIFSHINNSRFVFADASYGSSVEIIESIFNNGTSGGAGGDAVKSQDFESKDGGCVYLRVAKANIQRSQFTKCKSLTNGGGDGGGAVSVSAKITNINTCIFDGNFAVTFGGALLGKAWRKDTGIGEEGEICVENSMFINNVTFEA